MAKTPENVYALLNKLWTPALRVAGEEVKEMQKIADKEKSNLKLNLQTGGIMQRNCEKKNMILMTVN